MSGIVSKRAELFGTIELAGEVEALKAQLAAIVGRPPPADAVPQRRQYVSAVSPLLQPRAAQLIVENHRDHGASSVAPSPPPTFFTGRCARKIVPAAAVEAETSIAVVPAFFSAKNSTGPQ